jgi:ATP-dependent helicase/nuclease subunit B
MTLNLFTINAHTPFLDAIAAAWLARESDPLRRADGLILLPTRRAARSLADAFLRLSEGRPLLLPRITAFGALDEMPLALAGALDLPPAVAPMARLSALTRLVLALGGRDGAPRQADGAWLLAEELANLMDEAERAEIDLAQRLPDAADPSLAHHWANTLEFLHIVTAAWPAWLEENGLMNPAARQVALLNAQAEAWRAEPPPHPVLIAGTTAGIPAVARLLATVARSPNGQVVFPALDGEMDRKGWDCLDESHPQAGLGRLLGELGATREDVRPWPAEPRSLVPERRFSLLSRTMLPAGALDGWRKADDEPAPALDGFYRLTARDQGEEAEAIALILRDALETPGARAALVTPDRVLATRVAAALLRFGVVADDSAGEALMETPPAVFLRLLVRAAAERLAPVPLLALLKHPLAAAGLSPGACRRAARALERACLRGPRPAPDIAGIRMAIGKLKQPEELTEFWARVETCLEPLLRARASVEEAPIDALSAVIAAAERLAETDEDEGPERLWGGAEGEALAARLSEVLAALPGLPDQRIAVLPGLLDAVLRGGTVRDRRALRGRDGGLHPRVFIWGLLEARLQSVDLLVLGGLAETIWPPATDPGPWLSRPMRRAVGMPSPEEIVGQSAHDFAAACCSAPTVVLSCPARRDGAPAVPARWLTRLEMFLEGRGLRLPAHPAAEWAQRLDLPVGEPKPVDPPKPAPAVTLRPRCLSVTEIETWLRDPYAIYAKHILKLPVLAPLDEATDASDFGYLVHNGMQRFLAEHGADWPPDARERLRAAMAAALRAAELRPALSAWWKPRLDRIATWVAEQEAARRRGDPPKRIKAEISGRMSINAPGGPFQLKGRADRIETRSDGTLAILDYKTGAPPSQKTVEAGLAPQLPLEAAMAATGAFGAEAEGIAAELIYWHLSGGRVPGAATSLFKGDPSRTQAAADEALSRLRDLIAGFDDANRPYLSHPRPGQAPRFPEYAQLARVREWLAAGDDEEEENEDDHASP